MEEGVQSNNSEHSNYYEANKSIHRSNFKESIKGVNSGAQSLFDNSEVRSDTNNIEHSENLFDINFEQKILTIRTGHTQPDTCFNPYAETTESYSGESLSQSPELMPTEQPKNAKKLKSKRNVKNIKRSPTDPIRKQIGGKSKSK
jgi:hypothetical protein